MGLRKKINKDLEKTMEDPSEWGLPIVLLAPDGAKYDTKKGTTDQLTGQVLYNRVEFNPSTGEEYTIPDPIAVLRTASLERIPKEGEKWLVQIPIEPDPDAELKTFALTPSKAFYFNRSIGIMRIYLQECDQV